MLPVARPVDGGGRHRHLAADRPDEEPGRFHAYVLRRVGRRPFPQFVAQQDRRPAGPGRRPGRENQVALLRARIPHQGGQCRVPA